MTKNSKKDLTLPEIQATELSKIGFFRFKKLDEETYIIVNDAGRFSYMSPSEFADFTAGKIQSGGKFEELSKKGFIKNEDYNYDSEMRVAKRHTYLGFGPALHIIVLTLRCNHACRYCHASSVPENATGMDMSKETAKLVIDAIFHTTAPGITIEFQGGEPTLNWDVLKFCVEYAETKIALLKKETIFTVVTNLSTMNEEMLEYCAAHKIRINTSLDGNKETHDFNRLYGDASSYDLVTQWIEKVNMHIKNDSDRRLRNMMGSSLGAMITVTKKSLQNWKECLDTYVQFDMKEIYWRPLNPYGF